MSVSLPHTDLLPWRGALLLCGLVAMLVGSARATPALAPPQDKQKQDKPKKDLRHDHDAGELRTAIERLLAELDAAFGNGDATGYLSRFEPDHPGAHGVLTHHLQRLFAVMHERERASKILVGPHVVRGRAIVRVRHKILWRTQPTKATGDAAPQREYVEDSYLAVRVDDAGKAVPTFAIEMPARFECVKEGRFHCPPCNYEIGGVDGFLCVPLRPEQSMTLESATFYLIGTDVACDVSVHVETEPVTAAVFAHKLVTALTDLQDNATTGIAGKWRPPAYTADAPSGMDAARIAVDFPRDQTDRGGQRMVFHVVTFGGLQHVLLLRGSADGLERHREATDELFSTYMLLRSECDPDKVALQPLRHHTGGVLHDNVYHNEHFDVVLKGPPGWRAQQRVGGCTFRVRWTGPNGSQLWLVGQRVPAGIEAWSKATATRWLATHCRKHGLERDPTVDDDGWRVDEHGVATRTLTLRQPDPDDPGSPRRRIVHARVHEDLLLLVDAFGGTDQEEKLMRRAIRTLTRK